MEHNPLSSSRYAIVRVIESRQSGQDGVVCVRHWNAVAAFEAL